MYYSLPVNEQDASDAAYPPPAPPFTMAADSSTAAVSPLASPPSTFGAFGPFVAQRKVPVEASSVEATTKAAPTPAAPVSSSSFSPAPSDAYEALAWAEVWAPVNDSAQPPRCLSVNPQDTKVIAQAPYH